MKALMRMLVASAVTFALWIYLLSFGHGGTPGGIQSWQDARVVTYAVFAKDPPKSSHELDEERIRKQDDAEDSAEAARNRKEEERRRFNEGEDHYDDFGGGN